MHRRLRRSGRRAHPRLLLILVPRKPERFDAAARKLAEAGIPVRAPLRAWTPTHALELPGVLLLDSIGELSGLFALADVVFMGGTLAARGGHNILEPALFARPVIVGPHMENFREIAREFLAAGAARRDRLGRRNSRPPSAALLDDPARAAAIGAARARRAPKPAAAPPRAPSPTRAAARRLLSLPPPGARRAPAAAGRSPGCWEWGGRAETRPRAGPPRAAFPRP